MVHSRILNRSDRPSEGAVVIDSFPDAVFRYTEAQAIVCVDVLNASTSLVTAVSLGITVHLARTREEALRLARELDALLVGEEEGERPEGFDLPDSPAAITACRERRPVVFFSPQGSELLLNANASVGETYVCSLRNLTATAHAVAESHRRIAIVGAGYHSEFSCEDQMACARFASLLVEAGFSPEDLRTDELIRRWSDAELDLIGLGNAAAALRRRGRFDDVDFALEHVDDLSLVVRARDGRVSDSSPGFPVPNATARELAPHARAAVQGNV